MIRLKIDPQGNFNLGDVGHWGRGTCQDICGLNMMTGSLHIDLGNAKERLRGLRSARVQFGLDLCSKIKFDLKIYCPYNTSY